MIGGAVQGVRSRLLQPMPCGRTHHLWRALQKLVVLTLVLLPALTLAAPAALALDRLAPLLQRQDQWPAWSLPAPLNRPGQRDLVLPPWMQGTWDLTELEGEGLDPSPVATVRFLSNRRGQVVGDRAFNALAIGRAALGDSLLSVVNDPANPNRQLARLQGDRLLESTVIGRRSGDADPATFLSDELALQILHGPGQPAISQVETLTLYSLQGNKVRIEQWQGTYAAPGERADALRTSHRTLLLLPSGEGAIGQQLIAPTEEGRQHRMVGKTRNPAASEGFA
jgi:hypothetical protein